MFFNGLMTTKRFAPLFWCQFLSAFNDNFLRNALIFMILFHFQTDPSAGDALLPLAPAVFMLPSFLLSALGGELADRYNKALVARNLKLAEIPAALIAVSGLWLNSFSSMTTISIILLFISLFLFGCISALFGPLKYGILPDLIEEAELPAGNALIEMATFIAILLGSIAGGIAMGENGNMITFGLLLVGTAFLSWFSSLKIPATREASPNLVIEKNIFRSTILLLKDLKHNDRLWKTGLILSWFWMVGIVMMTMQVAIVEKVYNGAPSVVTVFITMFAIGIAVGSTLAAKLASGRIIMLPVPVACIFMGFFCFDIGWVVSTSSYSNIPLEISEFFASSDGIRLALDFFGLAVCGGLYVVPSFAALQAWADPETRARMIGAVNVVSAAFMAAGSFLLIILQNMGTFFSQFIPAGVFSDTSLLYKADMSLPHICFLLAAANILVAILIFRKLPTSAFQDLLSIIFRAFYRTEIIGMENLKKAGSNPVIALNHVSFLDGALALSFLDQKPIFAIDFTIAKRWWVRPFLKLVNAFPLDPAKPLATRALIIEVNKGETLVIFPEGRLTITGALMKVYDGVALIADKTNATILPVKIDGLEKTPFSRLTRQQVKRQWWPKVTVTIHEPVKLEVDLGLTGRNRRMEAGNKLYNIMSDMIYRTAQRNCSIFDALVSAADEHGSSRIAMEDPVSGALSYKALLIRTRLLAKKMCPFAEENKAIGLLMPNSSASAAAFLAIMSSGRIPAMLNFTAGEANLRSACISAGIRTIVTSRTFIEKGHLSGLIEKLDQITDIVYLEDLAASITGFDKVKAALFWKKPVIARKADDPAAILFTSGSEGTPKGVVLSSRNMLTNIAQAEARIDFGRSDKVFNVLPLFHSFGLTIGTILPLICGVPVYLYPSPLHYRIVPELIYGTNATVLLGTDTFLNGYARTAHPYDFRSLRYVIAGAEPVKNSTRMIYLEKFGLRIFEGYGVTETAPVLALNTPMYNRFGTVGRFFPGIETRLEPVPGIEEGGRLHVRGPNIMLGYLKDDAPGILQPPPEGWYDTGDIVSIDKDGFVAIKGRAKRFAKIGGEMVSLAAIETVAAEIWPDSRSAAAAVPDAKKGEKVILFTEKQNADRASYQLFAKGKGIAEIMIPAEVIILEHLPLLGSGKTDFSALTKFARETYS